MLGFDALGRLALGQVSSSAATNTILTASTGTFAVTGVAAVFRLKELSAVGTYPVTGNAAPLKVGLTSAAGSFAVSGQAALFSVKLAAITGAYVVTGNAAAFLDKMVASGTSYLVTGNAATFARTGGDFDQVYGGIGHYLEELERQKQLARITRKTPAPIVQPSIPLPPLAASPMAPKPAPIDLQAIAAQRMAEAQAQAEQARILKRRQAIEILLLAS